MRRVALGDHATRLVEQQAARPGRALVDGADEAGHARMVGAGRPRYPAAVDVPGPSLHDAASMRATDRAAIEAHAVPGVDLMAGAAAAAELVLRARFPDARRVAVLCGGGNNGGDGLVVARLLRERGVEARVAVVASRPYAGDAAWAEQGAREAGLELGGSVEDALDGAELVVDALLGTGFAGAPRDAVAAAIDAIAASGRPVLALDVPSGVDASTGEVGDPAVRADVTVTFHAAKLGLCIEPGASHAGEVVVVDIGIPDGAEAPAPGVLVGPAAIAALPPRPRGGSKYDAGRVVVVAGSRGMTGACTLAGHAALRGGAGIVTACVAGSLEPILEVTLTEVMTRACPDRDGALQPAAEAVIREVAERGGPVVLGPGLGRDEGTQALVRALLDLANPLVLDADGLFALGEDLEALAARTAPTIITPHARRGGRTAARARPPGPRSAPARGGPRARPSQRRHRPAQGPGHDRRHARRAGGGARRRRARPRDGRDRRRPLRRHRRAPGPRRRAVPGGRRRRSGAPARGTGRRGRGTRPGYHCQRRGRAPATRERAAVIDAAVRDVMQSDPVTVPPEMELRDLVELFVNERLAAAPVVDGNGKLCGMVSERDIVLQEVEGDVHFPYFVPILDGLVFVEPFGAYEEQMQKAFAATVGDLMTREVRTVGPEVTIHEAAEEDGEARHLAPRGRRRRQARRRHQPGRRRARPRALRVRHPLTERSRVVIELGAVRANVRRLREALGPRALFAVVKADGYGHGAVDVGRVALDEGAEALCVATLGEARALRDVLPEARIIVMGPLAPGEEREAGGLEIVVGTEDVWARVRDRTDLGVHVKVETGMGRWGLDPDAALAVGRTLADARSTPGPRLCGLMSHLATADETDTAFARQQVRAFARVAEAFPPCVRHLANSAGTLRLPETRFDAGRCGIALYGISPSNDDPADDGLVPALRWTSQVAALRRLAPGDSSGYGRRLIAEEPLTIALVPVGYADGYPPTSPACRQRARARAAAAGRRDRLHGPARPAAGGRRRGRRGRRRASCSSARTAPSRCGWSSSRGSWARSATSSPRGSPRARSASPARCATDA